LNNKSSIPVIIAGIGGLVVFGVGMIYLFIRYKKKGK
jgi:hypothetical protein